MDLELDMFDFCSTDTLAPLALSSLEEAWHQPGIETKGLDSVKKNLFQNENDPSVAKTNIAEIPEDDQMKLVVVIIHGFVPVLSLLTLFQ